ncbi:MAG: hypothetical protein ANABAC_0817 [Anaerolineae bacterium]|nr:MAG: hypothetical protein ANABAC_0817 [Anaerolineae bacterium]
MHSNLLIYDGQCSPLRLVKKKPGWLLRSLAIPLLALT